MLKEKKTVLINFIAIAMFVAVICFSAGYFIFNIGGSGEVLRLSPPQDLSITQIGQSAPILNFEHIEEANSYGIEVLNRTLGSVYYIHVIDHEVNGSGYIEYDLSSFSIASDNNYAFSIKANSDTIEDSGYSDRIELENVDSAGDANPYVE
jgi:hypothetical protein